MILIKNLSKYYKTAHQEIAALKNINLEVAAGQIFGIIGRSGAGKSSLIRCLNMLERPSAGDILIEGKCLTEMPANELRIARRQIGMIFQNFNLLHSRNVFENIALPLELVHTPSLKILDRVNELLQLTELQNHASHYPSQLSGGQKQRVAIARALATSPKVLLCDEATSSLDPQSTQAILTLLQEINRELGITIIIITHEMNVVKSICDEVAILHQGEIIEKRKVIDLFIHPKTTVAQELVQTAARLEIPRIFKERLSPTYQEGGILIRVAYHGSLASQPIISYLIQQYRIMINILQGTIETIKDQIVGVLIVEIIGDRSNIEKSITFLEKNDLKVEILGYVQRAS